LDFCLFVSTAPEPAPIVSSIVDGKGIVSSIVDGKGLIWARAIEVAAHIDTDPVNAAALKAQPQMSAFPETGRSDTPKMIKSKVRFRPEAVIQTIRKMIS